MKSIEFNEKEYLSLHPDVADAVWRGEFKSGLDHYNNFGKNEGRKISINPNNCESVLQYRTKRSTLARHTNLWTWIGELANKKNFNVLEIGSRSVVSDSLWKRVIPNCNYTGFDVLPGKNVDVVGDAHKLSQYFCGKKFDLIFSFAVLEHIAMPWIVAEEIKKILNDGGYTAHETHFSYSEHELPWHFFQFNSNALEIIFCEELGFKLIDSGLDNPIDGVFSSSADSYLAGQKVTDLYCHSSIISQMKSEIALADFSWGEVAKRIYENSMYPKNTSQY